jgi:hypothetical protein
MKNSVKSLWLGSLLTLVPCLPAVADNNASPLSVQAFDSGTVIVMDNLREIVHINPVIFTGNFVEKHWEGYYPFKAGHPAELKPGFNALAQVHGVPVDLQYSVEPSGTGLHIHYHLVPRESVEVSCVQVYASFPYSDWQGDPYEFNDNEGLIPADKVTDWVIRQADSAPLSMGPSHTYGGLTVQMTSEGLHLVMADNRFYSPQLCMVYSHNDSKPNWIWEKGEKKDFDFTITFNRPVGSGSAASVGGKANNLPALTPTITPTPLENDCLDRVIDDFEDPGRNGSPPTRINRWGGKWNTVASSDSRLDVSYIEPGAENTRFSAAMSGENPVDSKGGDAVFQTLLFANGAPFNTVIHGLTGVQFWMKGDGNSYWFNVLSSAVTDINGYSFNVVPPKGVWTLFRVPFREMSLKSWWETEGGEATHPDGSNITGIGFESKGRGSFAFNVGQISFYGNPSNCPSPKVPEEPTLVPTPMPTPWPTRTFTAIPSDTPWPTSTPIPIPTATLRPTPVPLFNSRPSPAPYSFPVIIPLLKPTLAPISLPTPPHRPRRIRIQPTPTWVWRPTRTATPWPTRTPMPKNAVPTPTMVAPALLSLLDKDQTIEFAAPPANIYVTFGDGPGWYQLQIVDKGANLVKTIYDRHIVAEADAWVEWDGQNAKGEDMPPGQYFVVIYKDGKALKSISVVRSPTAP